MTTAGTERARGSGTACDEPTRPADAGLPARHTSVSWTGAHEEAEGDPTAIELSVIVPTYRDGDRVYANLGRLYAALSLLPYTFEVVVVSDGNTDNTAQETARFARDHAQVQAYHYTPNQGKGYALTYGVARAQGRLITFIDGDGDIDPCQIQTYVQTIEHTGADVVVGSKRHPQSRVVYPEMRRLYSWGYQSLLRVLFNLQVRDTQVGLKVFRRPVLEAVLPRIVVKRYAFDLELLVVACHLGYCNIVEAPVTIGERFSTTINTQAVRNMLKDTLAIFYRKNILHYYDRAPHTALADVPLLMTRLD